MGPADATHAGQLGLYPPEPNQVQSHWGATALLFRDIFWLSENIEPQSI